jgi:N-glycosylase/DNA lyase
MACSIAEAYYGIEDHWIEFAKSKLDEELRKVINDYYEYLENNKFLMVYQFETK